MNPAMSPKMIQAMMNILTSCRGLAAEGSARLAPGPVPLTKWPLGRGRVGVPPGLEPAGRLLGLVAIFIRGAPEEQASGHFPDRHGDVQITGDAQEIGFHPRGPDLRPEVNPHGVGGQRLNRRAQRLIQQGLHAGPSPHAAGVLEGDVVERDRGG
jgi:hypothetical protein